MLDFRAKCCCVETGVTIERWDKKTLMEKDLDSVSSKSCSSLVKEDNLDYSSSSIDRFLKDNLDLSSLHVGEIDHSQGSKSDDMNENDDFYQKMNRKMIENGFQSILSPDRTVDANLLNLNIENMLYEYEQRGELLKECMMEKTNASDEHRFDRLYSENEKLKKELDKSKDRVAKVEGTWKAEMDRMVEKVNMEKQGKLEMKKQLEIEKANMVKVQRELLQKEKYIEKVKNQMETTKEREGKKMDRIRKTVATLKGRKQGNLKIEDLVYMYEEEKENLKDEIAILRQELMQYQQQQAKNNVHVLDQPRDSQMLLEKMEQARLEQKKAMHDLHLREKVILKKVKRIENELQDARNAVQELGEENGNLQLAVKSRPSIASYRKLQHKLEKTQLDLASKCQLVADENERNELHAMLDTKTKIHQDKINHKLHLNRLQTLPKSILLQVVQTVCRILKINDLSLIESSILNLCKVVGSLPRLEFFIHEVYDAVIATMENKAQHIPLLRVAAIVRQWSTDIHEISQVKRFQHQVSLEIEKRSFQIQNKDQKNLTLQQCLYHIRELISLEQQWLKENDLYDQTDVLLQVHFKIVFITY